MIHANESVVVQGSTATHACRAREGVQEAEVSVHVCMFLFDILLHQGDVLLQKSFRERRRVLAGVFTALKPGYVELAQSYELHVCPEAPLQQTPWSPGPGPGPGDIGAVSCSGTPTADAKTMTVRTAVSSRVCMVYSRECYAYFARASKGS